MECDWSVVVEEVFLYMIKERKGSRTNRIESNRIGDGFLLVILKLATLFAYLELSVVLFMRERKKGKLTNGFCSKALRSVPRERGTAISSLSAD